MNTMEAIQSAMNVSLDPDQNSKLMTFMDFVDAKPAVSIKYLREAAWDIQIAMDNYLKEPTIVK